MTFCPESLFLMNNVEKELFYKNIMYMKITNILLICCSLIFGLQTKAEGQKKIIKQQQPPTVVVAMERLDRQASELLANRTSSTIVGAEELTFVKLEEHNELLLREDIMFPADELYNSNWDTINVNPFVKTQIDFPDTYTIDCSSFIMPIDNEVKITSK